MENEVTRKRLSVLSQHLSDNQPHRSLEIEISETAAVTSPSILTSVPSTTTTSPNSYSTFEPTKLSTLLVIQISSFLA